MGMLREIGERSLNGSLLWPPTLWYLSDLMKQSLLILLLLLISSAPSRAMTVVLSDGSILNGAILAETVDSLTIQTTFGSIGLARSAILYNSPDSTSTSPTDPDPIQLLPSFGPQEDQATAVLVRETLGEGAATAYSAMPDSAKADFLDKLWSKRSPLFYRYYYGYHLGRRHFSISPSYFERDNLIPARYCSGFPAHHPDNIQQASDLVQRILELNPKDAVALCALGYLKLEADELKEARDLFLKAIQRNRKFVEARNGRALSHLKMHHQKAKALDLFRETVAMDRGYVGALYAMGMCHIAMMGQDRVGLDDYFGKVVEMDPNHQDAYFKLGMFNEALRRTERAAEAYSRQLAVNAGHKRASERLAQVSMTLRAQGKEHLTHDDLVRLSEKDIGTYLPLLAESHIDRGEFGRAEECYELYIQTLAPEERLFYNDLYLIAKPEQVEAIETAYPRQERDRLRRQFWVLADPTPTTPVNERRVEHLRRVNHARTSYADGIDRLSGLGWDQRGDIYVRFGKPDHQSWSDFLVFETKPEVARVKNRINDLAHNGITEIIPPHQMGGTFSGSSLAPVSGDIRGIPTFPLPRRTTQMRDGVETGYEWESWIYGQVGGGIEVTFVDEIGKGFYEFARIPPGSPNRLLWQMLSPATVVGRIVSQEPSTYDHDHGGSPINLFVSSAGFRGEPGRTDFEVYLGIPVSQVLSEGSTLAAVDREVAFYDQEWNLIHRVTDRISHTIDGSGETEGLMIDQVETEMRPGEYFLAVQVRQPETHAIQIFRAPITITSHNRSDIGPGISDLEVAGQITPAAAGNKGKFSKGELDVVPLPTRQVSNESPISLYFEIYDLTQDAFGRTNYQVDYEVETSSGGLSIVSTLGKLIGRGPEGQTSRVSYEHDGDTPTEQMHVNLSLPQAGASAIRVTVRVTDLHLTEQTATTRPPAVRSIELNVAP